MNFKMFFFFCFFLASFSAFSEGDEEKKFLNSLNRSIEDNVEELKNIYSTNQKEKYENLLRLLQEQDSPELASQLLKEINMDISQQKELFEYLQKMSTEKPELVLRASRALDELKVKLGGNGIKSLTPGYCMLFVGLYFSTRDIAYSSRSFFLPNTSEDKRFVADMNKLSKGFEIITPMMCVADILVRRNYYADFVRELKSYQSGRENLKKINNIVGFFNSDKNKQKARGYNVLSSRSQKKMDVAILAVDELENTEVATKKKTILERFNNYLRDRDLTKIIKRSADGLTERDIQLLGSLQRSDNFVASNNDLLFLKKIKNTFDGLEEEFLKSLVASGEGKYDELKRQLNTLRNAEILNQKKVKVPTLTKLCFAAIGGALLIQGHISALGPNETVFDNIEDQWLRENRINIAYLSALAITPTCFSKIPIFISNIKKRKIKSYRLSDDDYRLIDKALENANSRYKSGEKIVTSKLHSNSAISFLARQQRKIILEDNPGKLISGEKFDVNKITQFTENERTLRPLLIESLRKNDVSILNELLNSKDRSYFDRLVKFLLQNDIENAKDLIKELKTNRFDTAKYLTQLKESVRSNPDSLRQIEKSLMRLEEDFKVKNIKAPSAKACAIALGTYIGTRDLLFSMKNSFIDDKLNHQWADTMNAADNLTGLGIIYFCLSDIIVHGKDLSQYVKEISSLRVNRKTAQELLDITREYQKNKKLQKEISKMQSKVPMSRQQILGFAAKLRKKTGGNETSNLSIAWQEFIQSKKMDRIFQKFREKLGREEKIKLNLILNSSALTEIEASHSLSVLDELNRGMVGEFEHWLKQREPQQRKVLLGELEKLKQYQKQRVQKHKEPGLGTKACFWGVGTILAGLGYHAAVGHKSNELDRAIEKEQRKRTREIFLAAQGIFLGTCGVNVIYNVLERVRKKKELGKNPFLKNTEKDWRELENVIKETQTNRTANVHLDETINDSRLVAKDIIRIMANRKKQYEKLEPRVLSDNDHKRLNRDMNKVLNDDFYFRFDQDCIKNFLKRSF